MDTLQLIAQELSLGLNQVQNALALFAEGGTDFAVHEAPGRPPKPSSQSTKAPAPEKKSASVQDLVAKFNKPQNG